MKKILASILCIAMVLSSMGTVAFAEDATAETVVETTYVATISNVGYTTFAEALEAASAMTDEVIVKIHDKVTLNQSLTGSYDSIKFVGTNADAEIYLEVQGYITASDKNVSFEDLTLSKSAGSFITDAGFMNVAFGVYDVNEVTYTNCTFANGAYASSGETTFTNCTFYKSHDKYSLWAYGDVDCTVDSCTFANYRGIKMYAEGAAKIVDLTVKNTDFSDVTNKPAIVLTYGESVTLENNTYSSTGVFELDLDGAPNGTAVTSDVAPSCKNDNGSCGVLVDGKIYTTVTQAAKVATSGSTVTLLHDSTETVELAEGVTLNKNGYTADGVTVNAPAPSGTFTGSLINVANPNATYISADLRNIYATDSIVLKIYDANDTLLATTLLVDNGDILDKEFDSLSMMVGINCTDSYWNTEWANLSADHVPAYGVLYIDGTKMNTAYISMRTTSGEYSINWADVPGVPKASLSGSGTEEDPYLINNIDDLKWFRDDVNSGNRYNGQYIKLTANIDLTNEEWTPIGNREKDQGSFLGIFDGDNHTISNLYISQWDKTGAGFFSKIGLQTEYVSGIVKNVTFNNVTIISSKSYVGVIGQAPLGALIENVHITGKVNITGYGYVGGIVGHGYPTINNSSVIAEGTITATYWGAGAIFGFAGDYGAKINNATVKGVDSGLSVHAELGGAALVAGSPYGAKINGATVSDATVTSNSDYYMGYVAAGGTVENATITNVTATAKNEPITPADVVAEANGKLFFDLQAAINEDGEVKVLRDNRLSEPLNLLETANTTLDLNGKTITGTDNATGSFGLINIQPGAELTINDTVGTGKITLTSTTDRDWNAYSSVISNQRGKLTVNGGIIEHLGGTDMAYAIDNLTNGKGTYAETIINGGTIKSTYRAVRQFLNGTEAQNILTVNGGTIEGTNKSIWLQDPSTNANTGTLTVGKNAVVKGDIYLFVTAGSTEWPVEISISAAALKENSTVVTGNIPDGYLVQEANGVWGVAPAAPVAEIDGVTYTDLQTAIDNANGKTVKLIDNVVIDTETITIAEGVALELDMNGKTITASDNKTSGNYELFYNYGELTVTGNGTIELTSSTDREWNASSSIFHNRGGKLTIENGTFTHKGGTAMAYVVDNSANSYGDATTVVNGGTLKSAYIAIRNRMEKKGMNGTPGNGIAILDINGGTFEGTRRAIWGQVSSSGGARGNIDISGGTFIADVAIAIGTDDTGEITTAVTGGTFSDNSVANYVADGYEITANPATGLFDVVKDIHGYFEKLLVIYNMSPIIAQQTGQSCYPIHVYAGIDSLDYKEVGFEITAVNDANPNGAYKNETTNVVYKKMYVTNHDGEVNTWNASDLDGNYMFGREFLFTVDNWKNADTILYVTPYAKTLQGETITGITKKISDTIIKEQINPEYSLFKTKEEN